VVHFAQNKHKKSCADQSKPQGGSAGALFRVPVIYVQPSHTLQHEVEVGLSYAYDTKTNGSQKYKSPTFVGYDSDPGGRFSCG
jgi:hypothetical protein